MSNKDVRLLINAKEHLNNFISLNEAWIKQYFELEPIDLQLAKNPSKIIDDGGFIFSLILGEEVVGVCALFKGTNDSYHLARMAVKESYRGHGFGTLLMDAVFVKAKAVGASSVILLSNSKLTAAISLYKKYGFVITKTGKHETYARVDIEMEVTFNW
jgi:ribosomal protein S18 acetylase RimI-like enzyme